MSYMLTIGNEEKEFNSIGDLIRFASELKEKEDKELKPVSEAIKTISSYCNGRDCEVCYFKRDSDCWFAENCPSYWEFES